MIDYLSKDEYNQVILCQDMEKRVLKCSLRFYINQLCVQRLSTLEATIEATSIIFGLNRKIPIFCSGDCLLAPLQGLRGKRSLFINYYSIQSIQYNKEYAEITFSGLHVMRTSHGSTLKKQIDKCENIIAYMNIGPQI